MTMSIGIELRPSRSPPQATHPTALGCADDGVRNRGCSNTVAATRSSYRRRKIQYRYRSFQLFSFMLMLHARYTCYTYNATKLRYMQLAPKWN